MRKLILISFTLVFLVLLQIRVTAAPIFTEDWELGYLNTSIWDDVGSTTGFVPEVVNSTVTSPHSGSYSLRAYSNTNGYQNSRVYRTFSDLESAIFSFWVKLEQIPSTGETIIMISNTQLWGTNNHLFRLGIRKDSTTPPEYRWRLYYYSTEGSDYIQSPLTDIVFDKWYYVEIKTRVGAAGSAKSGEIQLSVDGVTIGSATDFTNNDYVQAINDVVVGTETSNPVITYYDDLSLSGESYMPPPNRTISGNILGYYNFPIPEAIVQAGNNFGITDSNGMFSLTVPAGIYTLYAYKVGYKTSSVLVDVTSVDATNINLGMISADTAGKLPEIRSFTIFPYWFEYDSTAYDNLLDEIKTKYGDLVNFIEVRFIWQGSEDDIPVYTANYSDYSTNSWDKLAAAIDKAHSKGFKVLLGHVKKWNDPYDGSRNTSNWPAWWNAYKQLTVDGAIFAQQHNVELLHIGWEMGFMGLNFENGSFSNYWNDTIAAVKAVYSGNVSYETNWWFTYASVPSGPYVGFNDQLKNDWYSNLDYIALSTYPTLTNKLSPTMEELIEGWKNNTEYETKSYTETYKQLSEKFNKKILINTGYSSSDGANNNPWKTAGVTDHIEQAMIWQSFFDAWKDENFIFGVDLEHYDRPYSSTDRTASFRGKISDSLINEELSLSKYNLTKITLNYNNYLRTNNKPFINSTTNIVAGMIFNENNKQFKFMINGNGTGLVEIYSPYGEPPVIKNATKISYDAVTKMLKIRVDFPIG